METIGERLRRTRMRRVLNQEDLARLASVGNVTISRIENGYYPTPRLTTVRRLAEALDVDPAWLLYGDEVEEVKHAA